MKIVLVGILAAAAAVPAFAADTITADYLSEEGSIHYTDVSAGEPIKFVIKNACKQFGIKYRGFTPAQPAPEGLVSNACDNYCSGGERISEVVEHSSRYDGYEFKVVVPDTITRIVTDDKGKPVNVSEFCEAAKKQVGWQSLKDTLDKAADGATGQAQQNLDQAEAQIENAEGSFAGYKVRRVTTPEYLVVVESSPWKTDFSVGPSISWLTSPVYYLDSANKIQRDRSAEDDMDLILTGFAHVSKRDCSIDLLWIWPTDCSDFALSGGVGTSGSSVDYFIGGSYLWGPAIVTAGGHWGSVYRLPSGLAVGSTTTDATAVTESGMEERTDTAFFISLTYTFGGADEASFTKNIARVGGN